MNDTPMNTPANSESVAKNAPSLVATLIASQGDVPAAIARVKAAQARADELEPWLKAFYHRPASYDASTLEANALKTLAGVPIGIKDLIATADMPTTYGSAIYQGFQPAEDAWIVARIRSLGGTIFGKTVTTEFAYRHPGPTVNPWNPLHTPGGSSSGSAAAVGAGIVPLALGTQTMGSVLRPAAYCGVVGYKPTHGKIPLNGVHPLALSLDHVGIFARSVDDIALAHALFVDPASAGMAASVGTQGQGDAAVNSGIAPVVASTAAWEHYFSASRPQQVGIVRTPFWDRVSDEQKANFEGVLDRMRAAGVTLIECDPAADLPVMLDALQTILQVEAFKAIGPAAAANPDLVSAPMQLLMTNGATVTDEKYQQALALQKRLRAAFRELSKGCDVIVTVPATGEAPKGLADTGDATFCAPWSFLGVPAVSIPSGTTASGMPLGFQLVGDFGADLPLLKTAAWVESILR